MSDFDAAVMDSKKLTSKPGNEDLLELYALYKVAIDEEAPVPGMFDLKGKAKYNAWKRYADKGLTADEAKEKYVVKIEELKQTCGYDANKVPEAVGGK